MRIVRYTYPNYRNLAAGIGRLPWSGLEGELDRLFETALSTVTGSSDNRFPIDLYEDKDHTYVRAELPGVNRDDINVEMVEGYLNITGISVPANGRLMRMVVPAGLVAASVMSP